MTFCVDLAHNDIVFSMLGSDDAVRDVFGKYLEGKPRKGSIFVECSTVFPDLAIELAKEGEGDGVTFLAGPVFGRPAAAMGGSVLCVIAGDPSAKEKARSHILSAHQISQDFSCCNEVSVVM